MDGLERPLLAGARPRTPGAGVSIRRRSHAGRPKKLASLRGGGGSMNGRPLLLAYHAIGAWSPALAIPEQALRAQLSLLRRRGYVGFTAAEAERRRQDGTLAARAVVVTFDDGFRSVLRARPILEEIGFPATVFAGAPRLPPDEPGLRRPPRPFAGPCFRARGGFPPRQRRASVTFRASRAGAGALHSRSGRPAMRGSAAHCSSADRRSGALADPRRVGRRPRRRRRSRVLSVPSLRGRPGSPVERTQPDSGEPRRDSGRDRRTGGLGRAPPPSPRAPSRPRSRGGSRERSLRVSGPSGRRPRAQRRTLPSPVRPRPEGPPDFGAEPTGRARARGARCLEPAIGARRVAAARAWRASREPSPRCRVRVGPSNRSRSWRGRDSSPAPR